MIRSRQGRAGRRRPRRRAVDAAPGRRRFAAIGRRLPSAGAVAGGASLIAVVTSAALLRLWSLQGARMNPFYDAAVRSMDLSWHNFFFGALDPGGRISVDKPPVDLWLQVASTKLFGFNATGLLLPEALGGIIAAALLYATIRPVFGRLAAVFAGLALAVLPISVVTSRSDTMDSVMMALLVGALWCSVRGLLTRHVRWVVLAAAIVGLAFNVKLSEALVPLPALALVWWGVPRGWRRVPAAVGAVTALVVVGMLWIVVASLTPQGQRPYPIGSRNGSIYGAVFVYNGVERLNGTSAQVAPVASASKPGAGRLVTASHPFYGSLIGLELVAAVALAIACGLARRPVRRLSNLRTRRALRVPGGLRRLGGRFGGRGRRTRPAPGRRRHPQRAEPAEAALVVFDPRRRRRELATLAAATQPAGELARVRDRAPRAAAEPARTPVAATLAPPDERTYARRWLGLGLAAWMVTATALFSSVRDLEPRYLEAVSPALAGVLGIGAAALLRRAREPRAALVLALAIAASTGFTLAIGNIPGGALTVCLASSGLALALLAAAVRPGRARLARVRDVLLGLASATALLAAPVGVSIHQIDANATAAGTVGAGAQFAPYLHAHRHGAYYEVASASVYAVTTLIVADAQPVLVLNDFHGPIVSLAKLMDLIRRHAVRQIIISHACRSGPHCPLTTRWSLKHAREVVKGGLWEYVLPFTTPPRCVDRPRAPGCPPPPPPSARLPSPFQSIVLGGAPAAIVATPQARSSAISTSSA